jgi:protein transport protein SEC24
MMVVGDINNVFLPLAEERIFASYKTSKTVIENLLEKIPKIFAETKISESALGAAIWAGHLALVRGAFSHKTFASFFLIVPFFFSASK